MRVNRPIDQWLLGIDRSLKTMTGSLPTTTGFKYSEVEETLSQNEKTASAELMRINHCGEVCAQGLYHGQALTARNQSAKGHLLNAADDEQKHLIWCQERLKELDARTSYLNPLWYISSFLTGAVTGLMGDKVSLGFVAATEEEVCKHLDQHLEQLPTSDHRSREILEAIKADEQHHQDAAHAHGGAKFPSIIKNLMTASSKLMTRSTRWL